MNQVKIILWTNIGVGKTCILNRFISNIFDNETSSTTGAQFVSKTIKYEKYDKSIKFDIWDTAGQEKYRSIARIFYEDALVVILVYDVTRKGSFQELSKYWIGQVRDFAPGNVLIAIAANKSDLYDKEEVSDEEGAAFAKKIGAIFKTTSAKSNTGIDALFDRIGTKFIDPSYNYLEEERKVIEEYNKNKNIKLNNAKGNDNKQNNCKC